MKSRKSSQWNVCRFNILIRGCAGTKTHQEHQVYRDINGSYASIGLGRGCRPTLLAGKPTLLLLAIPQRRAFKLLRRNANMKSKTVEEYSEINENSLFTSAFQAVKYLSQIEILWKINGDNGLAVIRLKFLGFLSS